MHARARVPPHAHAASRAVVTIMSSIIRDRDVRHHPKSGSTTPRCLVHT